MKNQNNSSDVERQPASQDVLRTFTRFFKNEAAGGVILLICAVIAVTFASVSGGEWFDRIWEHKAGLHFGNFSLEMSLRDWINDALMAIFFFTVGLEIKREMLVGQLSSFKRSILPILGALGGMIVPAVIYALFNAGTPTAHGWGIPMATDIAFAVGVLSLLGNRVPVSLKVFLTALAIVDDLGAIIVLAIFYPSHALHFGYLAIALAILLVMYLVNRFARHSSLLLIAVPGLLVWYFIYLSGVHATIAGVLVAMVTPAQALINNKRFTIRTDRLLQRFKNVMKDDEDMLTNAEEQHIIHSLHREIERVDPLMHRFESELHPIVTYLIMPLFALANAGVAMDFSALSSGVPAVAMGIFFGLFVGKPLGIFLFSFLGIKLKLASQPQGASLLQLASVAVLGGIGFTMSIFVSNLAFADPHMVSMAKISILVTSTLAALTALLVLSLTCKDKKQEKLR